MIHETTFTDVQRDANDDAACFVMDEETFRAFYERTARGLWAYLARVTGDSHLADDLLQESYYRFLRASATHEGEVHRRNSLYRIATNLARDAHRRRLIQRNVHPAGSEIDLVPSRQDTHTAEHNADFTRAMAQMKPRERAILWLAYAEGASHREIAGVMGLSPRSLKAMLFRARRKLAGLLGGPR